VSSGRATWKSAYLKASEYYMLDILESPAPASESEQSSEEELDFTKPSNIEADQRKTRKDLQMKRMSEEDRVRHQRPKTPPRSRSTSCSRSPSEASRRRRSMSRAVRSESEHRRRKRQSRSPSEREDSRRRRESEVPKRGAAMFDPEQAPETPGHRLPEPRAEDKGTAELDAAEQEAERRAAEDRESRRGPQDEEDIPAKKNLMLRQAKGAELHSKAGSPAIPKPQVPTHARRPEGRAAEPDYKGGRTSDSWSGWGHSQWGDDRSSWKEQDPESDHEGEEWGYDNRPSSSWDNWSNRSYAGQPYPRNRSRGKGKGDSKGDSNKGKHTDSRRDRNKPKAKSQQSQPKKKPGNKGEGKAPKTPWFVSPPAQGDGFISMSDVGTFLSFMSAEERHMKRLMTEKRAEKGITTPSAEISMIPKIALTTKQDAVITCSSCDRWIWLQRLAVAEGFVPYCPSCHNPQPVRVYKQYRVDEMMRDDLASAHNGDMSTFSYGLMNPGQRKPKSVSSSQVDAQSPSRSETTTEEEEDFQKRKKKAEDDFQLQLLCFDEAETRMRDRVSARKQRETSLARSERKNARHETRAERDKKKHSEQEELLRTAAAAVTTGFPVTKGCEPMEKPEKADEAEITADEEATKPSETGLAATVEAAAEEDLPDFDEAEPENQAGA
jgi:hypothetical protein